MPVPRPYESETRPNRFWQYLAVAAIIGLISSIAIAIIQVIYFWRGDYDPKGQPAYAQGYREMIYDKPNNRNGTLILNIYSSTFGAQSPVDIYASYIPNNNNLTASEKARIAATSPLYFLYLPGTYCQPSASRHDLILPCAIQLNFNNATVNDKPFTFYRGNKTVSYAYGGTFDVILADYSGSESGVGVGKEFIKISSVDSTNSFLQAQNTYQTWKVSVVIASFAAIGVYSQLVIRAFWYLDRRIIRKHKYPE